MERQDSAVRQRRRPAEVRGLIIEAAASQFAEKGFAAATTTEIAERAGVSQSVLYRHFPNKADLFAEVVMVPLIEAVGKTQRHFASYVDQNLAVDELMPTYVTDLYTSLQEHHDAIAGLAGHWDELPEETIATLRHAIDEMFRQIHLLAEVEASRQQWYPFEGIDVVTRLIVTLVFGMTTYGRLLLPTGPGAPSMDDILRETGKLMLWGLVREDWRKKCDCPCPDHQPRST